LYSLTHHFILSLRLIQFGGLFASAFALHRLFAPRTDPWRAVAAAVLILAIPTMLYKFAELGGMMVYIPCLLWALHFALEERWSAFTVCTLLALGCRQGAIAWLAVPGIHSLLYLRQKRSARLGACLLSLGTVIAAYLLLSRFMNRSYAQVVMTGDMWRSLSAGRFTGNLLSCLPVLLLGPGLAALFLRSGPSHEGRGRRHPRLVALAVAVPCVVACLLLVSVRRINFEHPLYSGTAGLVWLGLLAALAALGLGAMRFHSRALPLLAGAGAGMALVCLRGTIYDYYCIDMMAFTLGALLSASGSSTGKLTTPSLFAWRLAQATLFSSMLLLGALSAQRLWRHLNEMATQVRVAETALQRGLISVDELGFAPFGLQGLHLFPYFVTHEGAKGDYIANFQNYLRPDALEMRAPDGGHAADPEVIVLKLSPLSPRRYYLLERKLPRKTAPWPLPSALIPSERFPLTEADWDALLHSPPPAP